MSEKPSLIQDIGESLVMANDIEGWPYGYAVTDAGIIAEEYGENGDIINTYAIEVTVSNVKESK